MSHAAHQGSSGGQNVSHVIHQESIGHGATTAQVASHGAAHGMRHLLSTVTGKIIAAVVVTTVVTASIAGVVLAHRSSGFASAYQGTAHNITVNQSSSLVFTSIVEDQQKISGEVYWGYPLFGDGPFTGTLGGNGSVTLTSIPVDRSSSQIIFSGSLHPDSSLSGTYTVPSSGQMGTWQMAPYQIPSNPHLVSTYHGTAQNYTVGGTATLTLTSVVQNQQKISGNLVLGPGLIGNGSFTGTVGADGGVIFIDNDTTDGFTVTFHGFVFADGSLSGSYNIPSSGQLGNWKVSPA
jgi:cytoskeletal protein CcmA (bactofilin family)